MVALDVVPPDERMEARFIAKNRAPPADSPRPESTLARCDQSWIDPGAAAGGEGGGAGEVDGAGVAGAPRNGAGILDVAFGADPYDGRYFDRPPVFVHRP